MIGLENAVKLHNASKSERKQLLREDPFNDISESWKELLITETENTDKLVREEINRVITQGAEKKRIFRDILPVYETNDYKVTLPTDTSPNDCAPEIAEGGSIPVIDSFYGSGNAELKKFGVRSQITHEMIEDCKWDIIETELERAGARLENALNKECLSVLLSEQGGDPGDVDPAGTHIAPGDVLLAKGLLTEKGWGNNYAVITHPTSGSRYLYDAGGLAGVFDGDETVWGMKPYECGLSTYDSITQKWDNTDAANHYYGLVLDSDNYAMIALGHDIRAEEKDDFASDLVNMKVTVRAGIGVMNDDAAVRILTK